MEGGWLVVARTSLIALCPQTPVAFDVVAATEGWEMRVAVVSVAASVGTRRAALSRQAVVTFDQGRSWAIALMDFVDLRPRIRTCCRNCRKRWTPVASESAGRRAFEGVAAP